MIVELFFDLIKSVILFFINLFPDFGILQQQIGSVEGLIELIAKSSYFVPWSTLFICLGIVVAFYGLRFTMSVINWVISKIPTIS